MCNIRLLVEHPRTWIRVLRCSRVHRPLHARSVCCETESPLPSTQGAGEEHRNTARQPSERAQAVRTPVTARRRESEDTAREVILCSRRCYRRLVVESGGMTRALYRSPSLNRTATVWAGKRGGAAACCVLHVRVCIRCLSSDASDSRFTRFKKCHCPLPRLVHTTIGEVFVFLCASVWASPADLGRPRPSLETSRGTFGSCFGLDRFWVCLSA